MRFPTYSSKGCTDSAQVYQPGFAAYIALGIKRGAQCRKQSFRNYAPQTQNEASASMSTALASRLTGNTDSVLDIRSLFNSHGKAKQSS
jgi:hypothetical protein